MPTGDQRYPRLFVEDTLAAGVSLSCSGDQANYLRNVLRLGEGSAIRVFNGRDGEWLARLHAAGRRACTLEVRERLRAQEGGPDVDYLFAPLKRARLDYMVQKAVELGAARLLPVITERTVAERVNLARMRANAIEAAEQCGILRLPDIAEPRKIERVVAEWDPARPLVFCDEAASGGGPLAALSGIAPGPVGLLVGPEGGFGSAERDLLLAQPFTVRLWLGPRVMRADTAAVAALALLNATLGDWRS
jgi:16S rRNA (uracil1498-N3)-methyltransferase